MATKNNNKTTFVLTDESVNSYGYRVLTSGIKMEQFMKNPVMLYAHDNYLMPIGTWENIRKEDGRLLADAKFDQEDSFAMEVARKVEAGIIRCCSIGFDVLEVLSKGEEEPPTVTKSELFECSICAIGANRNATKLSADGLTSIPVLKVGSKMTLTNVQGWIDGKNNINIKNSKDMTEQEKQEMEQLKKQVAELTKTNESLSKERDNLREAAKKARENEIEGLLSAAVKDGRIEETGKDAWKALLMADTENAKKSLEALHPRTTLSSLLESKKGQQDDYTGKSWDELDRAGQLQMYKENDLEGFKTLYKKTFGVDYKE